jgi:hypothetical protein
MSIAEIDKGKCDMLVFPRPEFKSVHCLAYRGFNYMEGIVTHFTDLICDQMVSLSSCLLLCHKLKSLQWIH